MNSPVHVPDLSSTELQFRRGQILKFKETPIIQLAYLPDRAGKPVALCLKPSTDEDKAAQFDKVRGMGVVRWTADGVDYLLVGDLPENRLMASAKSAAQQIAGKSF